MFQTKRREFILLRFHWNCRGLYGFNKNMFGNFWVKKIDLLECIGITLSNHNKVTNRTLANIYSNVISLTPAISYVSQIMTRAVYAVTNERDDWDQCIDMNSHCDLLFEFMFWKKIMCNWVMPAFFFYTKGKLGKYL